MHAHARAHPWTIVAGLVGLIALVARAAPADEPHASSTAGLTPIRAVVSIPPLKALVEPLVAALADANPDGAAGTVEILIPPGVSEHGYEIPPNRLAALAKADVVVYVGLGLEPQVEDFLKDHPSATRRVVEFAKIAGVKAKDDHDPHDHHEHAHDDHNHEHDHAHDGQDPHLWLDPVLVMQLVPAIRQAVEQAAIARADGNSRVALIKRRLDIAEKALLERVRAVDEEHRTRLAEHKGRAIVVAHDAWGLLAARYGFETVAIKGMLANEPTPQSIKAAVDAIRGVGGRGAKVVFTEPQLSKATSQRVADAAGAKLMELDPLGAGDWFSTMRANLDNIVAALEAQKPATPTPTPAPPANR